MTSHRHKYRHTYLVVGCWSSQVRIYVDLWTPRRVLKRLALRCAISWELTS